jgi:PAS domain S-box-containing protein
MFDWRELRRWNIDEKRLAPGSVVRFKEATYWEQHYRFILGAVTLFALQTFLIGALLIQRRPRRLAERSLRESEQRMNLAADAANLGIWIWDLAGDEIWATDKWRQLFGFEKGEQLDIHRFLGRLHPEDRDSVSKTLTKARKEGGDYEKESRIILPDGRMRWVTSRGRVEFDAGGEPVFMRGASLDNTARKLAEEAAHDLSGRLIHAQEEEHTRLARELHDDLSQSLALLSVELEMFGQSPPVECGQINECEIVGTACDGRALLELAASTRPDVIVLDISMPLLKGMDACAQLRRKIPETKFVFLTVNEDPDLAAEAIGLGASGYLLKNSASGEQFTAIELALASKTYVTPLITKGVHLGPFSARPRSLVRRKRTSRQREVLQLLAEGRAMKEVADLLHERAHGGLFTNTRSWKPWHPRRAPSWYNMPSSMNVGKAHVSLHVIPVSF